MLNSDYSDMLHVLSKHNVKFMLVGGFALAAHGYPRATLDIDLWVLASNENAVAVYSALKEFGTPMTGLTPGDFAEEGMIFQIGVAPRRIDIITKIDGVDFNDAYAKATPLPLNGISIPVISLSDLLVNKKASNRLKDLADVELLKNLLNKQS